MAKKRIIICEVCLKDDISDEIIEKYYTQIHQQVKGIVGDSSIYVDTFTDETDYDED